MSDEPTDIRAWLEAYLTPLVPESWRIIPSVKLPETIDRPTVTITHTKITPNPALPHSENLVNDVVIRVADPHNDLLTAENALDDQVLGLIHILRGSERLRWTEAEKVQIKETPYFGWDITVQVLSSPTPPETE